MIEEVEHFTVELPVLAGRCTCSRASTREYPVVRSLLIDDEPPEKQFSSPYQFVRSGRGTSGRRGRACRRESIVAAECHFVPHRCDRKTRRQLNGRRSPPSRSQGDADNRIQRVPPIEVRRHGVAVQIARGFSQRVADPPRHAASLTSQEHLDTGGISITRTLGKNRWAIFEDHGVAWQIVWNEVARSGDSRARLRFPVAARAAGRTIGGRLRPAAEPASKWTLEAGDDLSRALVAQVMRTLFRQVEVFESEQALVRRRLRLGGKPCPHQGVAEGARKRGAAVATTPHP